MNALHGLAVSPGAWRHGFSYFPGLPLGMVFVVKAQFEVKAQLSMQLSLFLNFALFFVSKYFLFLELLYVHCRKHRKRKV